MKTVSLVSNIKYSQDQIAKLEKIGEFINVNANRLNGDDIIEQILDTDILIVGTSGVEKIDDYVLSKCSRLKFISVLGVATDFIDHKSANRYGIKISNLRGANSESVAEHVWGLVLGLSKRIPESHTGLKETQKGFAEYCGIELQGKTLGIVGFGEVGSRVARIAKGFDMKILAFNRTEKELDGVIFVDLETLCREADVIALTIPLSVDTTLLINKDKVNLMRENVIIVSISRESIVDNQSILQGLESGKIFGFGMEMDIKNLADERFYKYSNVIITPHTAFYTKESELKSNEQGIENVIRFVEGKPQNLVN